MNKWFSFYIYETNLSKYYGNDQVKNINGFEVSHVNS